MAEILGLTHVDPLAERYRATFDKAARIQKRFETARAEWIEATLELAAIVLEARNRYPDHHEFSRWLGRYSLQPITQAERSALLGFARNLEAARKMLQESTSYSWRGVWEKAPKRGNGAPSASGRGPKNVSRRGSRPSGHAKRTRAPRIPTVMQERPYERLQDLVLTREQVDPDFKGDFTAEYGHVTLHTKAEKEHNKRQEVLQKWLASRASAARAADAEPPPPDPETLAAWLAKPGKAAKMRGWQDSYTRAAQRLQPATPTSDINSPEVMERMDAELECAIPMREPRLL